MLCSLIPSINLILVRRGAGILKGSAKWMANWRDERETSNNDETLPQNNMEPENAGETKRNLILQGSIFRCWIKFQGKKSTLPVNWPMLVRGSHTNQFWCTWWMYNALADYWLYYGVSHQMIQNCQPLPVHRPACPESSLAEATFTTNCSGLINPPSKVKSTST